MKTPPKYINPQPIAMPQRVWPSQVITKAPVWCSVDLRDGNQALPNPMSPDQKREYFELLCQIGFKHIEVAFPSASQDDFNFVRSLIVENRIPDDVFIMTLSQCRETLIERTFESLQGVARAIVHLYIATSPLHMGTVFNMTRQQTIDTAVRAVRLVRERADAMPESDIRFEFSPEEFTDTDLDFAVEICTAVYDAWGKATPEKPLILNLPATVERRPPNQYADMIELFCQKFPHRQNVLISVHSHNDQGMAVAGTELTLMAGADRVEGTLFGHGERTGNVDLVTVANNLFSRGIETGLDFSKMNDVIDTVERLTGMDVYYRQPYAGTYVFTAFSGSHQDAIRKGFLAEATAANLYGQSWKVPYIHIDPADMGRAYENIIRINSQSGKGGAAYILEREFGVRPPKAMHPEIGRTVQKLADQLGREIESKELWACFQEEFIHPNGKYELLKYWPRPDDTDPTLIHGEVRLRVKDREITVSASGNGPISAFMHALRSSLDLPEFTIENYDESAIGHGADAKAIAYVPLMLSNGKTVYGAGVDTNIDQAAVRAIIAALNRLDT